MKLTHYQASGIVQSPLGSIMVVVGSGILFASVVSFHRRGRGTLAPWDPPKHLVVHDLYRFNRNPMYVGVVIVVFGWALRTGNPWNYGYALIIVVIFHARVILYEEKEMQRLFGREWDAYRRAVPRWGLRFRPYAPNVERGAAPNGGSAEPTGSSRLREGRQR